jgi:hypothetical protein
MSYIVHLVNEFLTASAKDTVVHLLQLIDISANSRKVLGDL